MLVKWSKNTLRKFQSKSNDTSANMGFAKMGADGSRVSAFYFSLYFSLRYLKKEFAPEAIPWADALASAAAYTGMWLMAKKKVESWIWWIITNIASIPLYFIKGYTFTSVQFIILLVLAIAGLKSWNDKAKNNAINTVV